MRKEDKLIVGNEIFIPVEMPADVPEDMNVCSFCAFKHRKTLCQAVSCSSCERLDGKSKIWIKGDTPVKTNMIKKTFEICYPDEYGEHWLNTTNLAMLLFTETSIGNPAKYKTTIKEKE